MAGDLQRDKLGKQVYYCSFNEHLHIVQAQFGFSFFPAQIDLFWLKNTHAGSTAVGNINHLSRIQVQQLTSGLAVSLIKICL